jgi:hypothetical protein
MMDLRQKAVALVTVLALDLLVFLFGGLLLFVFALLASAPLAFAVLFRQ